jgi:hypothetical protein
MTKVSVPAHTRGGRRVRPYTYDRDQEAKDQRKRHAFERRVLAERQRGEAKYPTTRRTPGERRRKTLGGKAKTHWGKARRSRRNRGRNLRRAAGFGLLTGAQATGRGIKAGWRKLAGEWS